MTPNAADHAVCADVLRASGSNFTLPIRLLPRAKREGTTALYAFCRRADDIVDDSADPGDAATRLDAFEKRFRLALAGEAVDDPVIRAVADSVRRFGIPPTHLFDILDGVRMDLHHEGFATAHDLEEYCRRVASAVGLSAIHVWGFLDPEAPRAAHDCGLAFQLTNILRDISEDRGRGRFYLPREDLRACGCSEEDLAAGRTGPSFRCLAARLVGRAETSFKDAARLDRMLSTDGRIVFRAMFGAYHALFRAVRRAGDGIFTRKIRPSRAALLVATVGGVVLGPRP